MNERQVVSRKMARRHDRNGSGSRREANLERNVCFRPFAAESCLSGLDPKADVPNAA